MIKWSLLLISSLIETNINEENKLRNDQTMDLHYYILLEKFFSILNQCNSQQTSKVSNQLLSVVCTCHSCL